MKKYIFLLFIVIIIILVFQYQRPIMDSAEAIDYAVTCLSNPPEELGIFPYDIDLESMPLENIFTNLTEQEGFYNQFMNKRLWEVRLILNEEVPTVVMDAYSGKCISVYGPVN